MVNAGIYVLNPEIISLINTRKATQMTDFLIDLIEKNVEVNTFPIYETWSDIGTKNELKKNN